MGPAWLPGVPMDEGTEQSHPAIICRARLMVVTIQKEFVKVF